MNENWCIIKNLEDFINASRRLVFKNFGSKSDDNFDIENILVNISTKDEKEMDDILSYSESLSIAKGLIRKQKNKKDTKQIRYLLNDKLFMQIIEDLNARMISNLLNSLVQKGLVESAYDNESNDFIFWIKDEYKKTDTETPEAD